MRENGMVGQYHQLHGHEFEQTLIVVDGQGNPCMQQSMGSQRVGHDGVTEMIIYIGLPMGFSE